jgi:hypothetical protein
MTTIWAEDELLDDDVLELAADELADEAERPPLAPPEAPPLDPPFEPLELEPLEPDADEPDDPLLPELETCWPTLRSTEATVPAMVAVNEALARSVWSEASWDWADMTDA